MDKEVKLEHTHCQNCIFPCKFEKNGLNFSCPHFIPNEECVKKRRELTRNFQYENSQPFHIEKHLGFFSVNIVNYCEINKLRFELYSDAVVHIYDKAQCRPIHRILYLDELKELKKIIDCAIKWIEDSPEEEVEMMKKLIFKKFNEPGKSRENGKLSYEED